MRNLRLFPFLILLLSAFAQANALSDVNVVSFKGPVGTTKISPANGSSTAYLMNVSGQKSVCFKTYTTTEVFIASATAIGANGYPLTAKGDTLCMDLLNGTTLYFYGNGAGADVRAIFAR